MDQTRVRNARPDDATALVPLLEAVGFPVPAETIAERLETMAGPGELMLVAERRLGLVGLLTVHIAPVIHRSSPAARLTLLSVAENARGQGVGRALVQAAERELTERGCELVEVISNRRFTGAHGFYERLGYELTSFKFKKLLTPK